MKNNVLTGIDIKKKLDIAGCIWIINPITWWTRYVDIEFSIVGMGSLVARRTAPEFHSFNFACLFGDHDSLIFIKVSAGSLVLRGTFYSLEGWVLSFI